MQVERVEAGQRWIETQARLLGVDVDEARRLVRRRNVEWEIFQSIERAGSMDIVARGFEKFDEFLKFANSVMQRRKSRSGNSLEFHVRHILIEEGLVEGTDFSFNPRIEGGKKPDFLFPGKASYDDPEHPDAQLRILAAKTTLRDRWRQILREADRIPVKHAITLQEGLSDAQFREMREAGLQLVVPVPLWSKYPDNIRDELWSLERFIAEARALRK